MPLRTIQLLINAFYGIDIAVTFLTAIQEKNEEVKDLKSLALRYAKSSLIFDLLAFIPWQEFQGTPLENLSILALFKTIKLVHCYHMLVHNSHLKQESKAYL